MKDKQKKIKSNSNSRNEFTLRWVGIYNRWLRQCDIHVAGSPVLLQTSTFLYLWLPSLFICKIQFIEKNKNVILVTLCRRNFTLIQLIKYRGKNLLL